jgi:hypothetical protein
MAKELAADQRRALELLAASPNGCTELLFLAHGFTRNLLADLILAGFVSAETERVMAEGWPINVRRIRITDAGRRALS